MPRMLKVDPCKAEDRELRGAWKATWRRDRGQPPRVFVAADASEAPKTASRSTKWRYTSCKKELKGDDD